MYIYHTQYLIPGQRSDVVLIKYTYLSLCCLGSAIPEPACWFDRKSRKMVPLTGSIRLQFIVRYMTTTEKYMQPVC